MLTQNYNGQAIKDLANIKGFSAKELADKMNVTRQNVYEVFRKESVKRATALKFYEALGVAEHEIESLQISNNKKNVMDFQGKYIAELENRIEEQSRTIEQLTQALISALGKYNASGLLAGYNA